MGLYAKSVNKMIAAHGITPTPENYHLYYDKYRDILFMERYGMTFQQWKEKMKEKRKKRREGE